MGQDIGKSHFSELDFERFQTNLRKETAVLSKWFSEKRFSDDGYSTGLELEFWLTDKDYLPAPQNKEFLKLASDPNVVTEISKFNAEINSHPVPINETCLQKLHQDIEHYWNLVQKTAGKMGLHAIAIGSIPTLRDHMLGLEFLSDIDRYRALNHEVMQLRRQRPIQLDIDGKDSIRLKHNDIMLEACATSLQVHLAVPASKMVRYFNASLLVSAPLVAISANSPYLFGKDLWDETRIPVFEQSVRLPSFIDPSGTSISRVNFGTGYLRESLFECFLENLDGFPPLLPMSFKNEPEWLSHLRLHNGTIWRWNRPIIGLSSDGKPHLRIEQRVPSAGPSIADMIANAAFYIGLVHSLATRPVAPETLLSFEVVRENFYESARRGFSGQIQWTDGKTWDVQQLLHDSLLQDAKDGLLSLGVSSRDAKYYIDEILVERVRTGRNGASWQRSFIATHGADFQALVAKYHAHQCTGKPVHQWSV